MPPKRKEDGMTVQQLLLWCQLHRRVAVEWEVGGRIFQAADLGPNAGCGVWERFFPAGSHPTRRNVGNSEAQGLLAQATEFLVYAHPATRDTAEHFLAAEMERRVANPF